MLSDKNNSNLTERITFRTTVAFRERIRLAAEKARETTTEFVIGSIRLRLKKVEGHRG